MKRFLRILALFLLSPVLHAQDLAGARAFAQQLYAAYEHPTSRNGPDVLGKSAIRIFSPSLLQLIRYDQAHTPPGDAPDLDGDPICDCQDPGGLHLTALDVAAVDATHASAKATLRFPREKSARILRLSLLFTPAGWRVDDVATADTPSLRAFLQKSR
jgi:Protein of unknown function (DUF3828)